MEIRIPVYRPSLNGNEKKYVNQCLDSTWISSKGEFISRFEHGFANFLNTKYAASVSNGTVALHLALVVLGIGPGDEVIVPTLTYVASVNAITYTGATPVFVDSIEDTWQMDPADVEKKITPNAKAIMVVHLYGYPCDMDALKAIAVKHSLFLVEDCAEAIGTEYKGKPVGTFGDIAAFSFFGNKMITTGEGGMVVTNDQTIHDRSTHYRGQGLSKHRFYWHDVVGYNYRMTNICAALGLAQLEQIDLFINRKQEIAELYIQHLNNLPLKFHKGTADVKHSYWMCSILLDDADKRDLLMDYLGTKGVETRPLFYPVHTMPMYAQNFQKHPVAESLGWRGINLPSFPALTDDNVIEICAHIKQFFIN